MPAPRITLVIHSLSGGGAEMSAARMANAWADAGVDVTLITLSTAEDDRYQLQRRVRRIALDLMRRSESLLAALWNNGRRVAALRRAIADSAPDSVIAFTPSINVLTLLATRAMGVPVISSERSHPEVHDIGRLWRFLRRRTYRFSAAVVAQSDSARQQLIPYCGADRVRVIPNCVWPHPQHSAPVPAAQRPECLISVGRLDPNKGFDVLIDAFAAIADKHPHWNLQIVGDGPQAENLCEQIQTLGLSERIELRGWLADPYEALQQCQVFVLASRYEGFPNSLLEAMASGTAVISFDCDHGPREIIRHEIDGLLVPPGSTEQLGKAIDRLLSDSRLRWRLAEQATAVEQRFATEQYFERWDALLADVTHGK